MNPCVTRTTGEEATVRSCGSQQSSVRLYPGKCACSAYRFACHIQPGTSTEADIPDADRYKQSRRSQAPPTFDTRTPHSCGKAQHSVASGAHRLAGASRVANA